VLLIENALSFPISDFGNTLGNEAQTPAPAPLWNYPTEPDAVRR
jgi:hypothetical protein